MSPEPSPGDVLIAAAGLGWPVWQGAGIEIAAGEAAWRAAMTPDLAAVVWDAWHDDAEGGAGESRSEIPVSTIAAEPSEDRAEADEGGEPDDEDA